MERRGALSRAAVYLQRLLDHDAVREDVYRELMRLLLAQGYSDQAAVHYTRCCEMLTQEFGSEPDEETRRLYAQALAAISDRGRRLIEPPAQPLQEEAEDLLSRPGVNIHAPRPDAPHRSSDWAIHQLERLEYLRDRSRNTAAVWARGSAEAAALAQETQQTLDTSLNVYAAAVRTLERLLS